MSTDFWDGRPEDEIFEDEGFNTGEEPFVFVNGAKVQVNPGSSFKDTIKETARNAGMGKFRVFLNGQETLPSDAPETIGEEDQIELRKYDVAG